MGSHLNKQREQQATQDPLMTALTAIPFALLAALSLFLFLYPRRRDRSLKDLRGPKSSSFLLGNVYRFDSTLVSDQSNSSQVTRVTFGTKMK